MDYLKRQADHLKELRRNRHKNNRLQNCFNKYGENSLLFELIMYIPDSKSQVLREQEFIDAHFDMPHCMNLNRSAKTCDAPWTIERRQKISLAATGRKTKLSREACEQRSLRMMGHRLSDETKRKIARSRRGKTMPVEFKKRLSERNSGEGNPMFGRLGTLNPNSKKIEQIEIGTMRVIREFASAAEVGRVLGHDPSYISKACKGVHKSAHGYLWRYKESVTTIESA